MNQLAIHMQLDASDALRSVFRQYVNVKDEPLYHLLIVRGEENPRLGHCGSRAGQGNGRGLG